MKLRVLFMLLLAVAMTSVSCNKDDDDNGSGDSFTYNGTTYDLSQGYIISYGNNGNESFDFDVVLVSEGLVLDADGDFSGTGDYVLLDLNTNSSAGLVDGTYTYDEDEEDRDSFILTFGDAGINFNPASGSGTLLEANAGTVTVDGDEITFDLTIPGGQKIEGSFEGMLTPL